MFILSLHIINEYLKENKIKDFVSIYIDCLTMNIVFYGMVFATTNTGYCDVRL